MNKVTEPLATEEPLPGWLRFEPEGGRVWFKNSNKRCEYAKEVFGEGAQQKQNAGY